MALGFFERPALKGALENTGLNNQESERFVKEIENNPALENFARTFFMDERIDKDTKATFMKELVQKWKDDPDVLSKLGNDLKNDPILTKRILVTASGSPEELINSLKRYTGGDFQVPAIGSYPEAEKKYASMPDKPSPIGAVAAAVAPRPKTEEESAIEFVQAKADELAETANKTYGVPKSTTDGFSKSIKQNPAMALAIAKNLQGQPALLKAIESQKGGLSTNPAIAQAQRAEMNKIMANPQLLANGEYTLRLQQKLEMAEDVKAGNYGKLFAPELARFKEAFSGFSSMLAGFSGSRPVISMGGDLFSGGGFRINLDNLEANRQDAFAKSRYSNDDVTALSTRGQDGKFFHNGDPIKGPDGKQAVDKDGKPQFVKVPNGQISIKDLNGKDMKIIPAGGELMAMQRAGRYEGGKFIEGTVSVPVATDIDENGKTKSFAYVDMTSADFKEYKKKVDALATAQGRPGLQFQDFTEADARKQGIVPSIQVVKVDPQTGATKEVTLQTSGPQQVAKPVQPGRLDPAANERDMSLQA